MEEKKIMNILFERILIDYSSRKFIRTRFLNLFKYIHS